MNDPFSISITSSTPRPLRLNQSGRHVALYRITAHNNAGVVQRLTLRRSATGAILFRAPIAADGGGVPIDFPGEFELNDNEDIELFLDADNISGVDVNFQRWERR